MKLEEQNDSEELRSHNLSDEVSEEEYFEEHESNQTDELEEDYEEEAIMEDQ